MSSSSAGSLSGFRRQAVVGEVQLDCVLLLLLLLLPPSGVPEGVCCCPSCDPRAADGCLQTGDVSTPQLVWTLYDSSYWLWG
jgi:hypothetical protein